MARRVARPFARGPRKATDWSASTPNTGYTGLSAATIALAEGFQPIAGGETIIRTRGLFTFGSDQQAADEQFLGAIGIGVVSEQAFTVGVTAIPDPVVDAEWGGWLYHSFFANFSPFSSATGFDALGAQQLVIDSKAMRKIGENERLVLMVTNAGGFGLQFTSSLRILTKVH